jgi:hypothetical protein
MAISDWLIIGGTALGVLFLADLIFAIDHYLVHHDVKRYKRTHGRHHQRYFRAKDAPQLDAYELSTYNSAGFGYLIAMSVATLFTGNLGFVLGAAIKWVHSLTFHLYQHGWWSEKAAVRKLELGRPNRSWGLATARYHAWHHSDPSKPPFTYAESWAGFDRILEMLDPWIQRYTVDVRNRKRRQLEHADRIQAKVAERQAP